MTRLTALALALVLAGPAGAADPDRQLSREVARQLPTYGFAEVDVRDLTPAQVAAIAGIVNRDLSYSQRRSGIRSVLGGRYSLRGLLFR